MVFFEETKYFLLFFLIFFISVISFYYYKYNDIFCNNQINLPFFQKKRDQKELLISEWYKRTFIPEYIKIKLWNSCYPIKDNSFMEYERNFST